MRLDLRVGAPVRFPRVPAEGLGGRVSARLEAGRGAQPRSSEAAGQTQADAQASFDAPVPSPALRARRRLGAAQAGRAADCLSVTDGCGALTFRAARPPPSPGAPSPLLSGSFAGWPHSTVQTGGKKKKPPKKVGRGPFEIISLIRAEGSLL